MGDVLEVLGSDAKAKEWTLVTNVITRSQGYVPANFIAGEHFIALVSLFHAVLPVFFC